jgi:hypothetical protein
MVLRHKPVLHPARVTRLRRNRDQQLKGMVSQVRMASNRPMVSNQHTTSNLFIRNHSLHSILNTDRMFTVKIQLHLPKIIIS